MSDYINENLVLIGGTGRCGSTMLVKALRLHPEIEGQKHETQPTPKDLGVWLDKHVKPFRGNTIIVEKSPCNALYAPEIMDRIAHKFRSMRYLHIRRNIGMTVESMWRHGGIPYPYYGQIRDRLELESFCKFINMRGERLCRELGGLMVDYDKLVTDPERRMRAITSWLGVKWDQDWFDGLQWHQDRAVAA